MRLARLGAVCAAALVLSPPASATPVYYTFTGLVGTTMSYDPGTTTYNYNVAVNGLEPGEAISYTFMIDLALQAREQVGLPSPMLTYTYSDTPDIDFVLSSYASGDAFPRTPLDGTSYNYRLDYGYRYSQGGNEAAYLYDERYAADVNGDYRYDSLTVYSSCSACSPYFQVGQTFATSNLRYLAEGGEQVRQDYISSWVTLTNISEAAPVPEPGTLFLLCSGLAAFTRLRRRT